MMLDGDASSLGDAEPSIRDLGDEFLFDRDELRVLEFGEMAGEIPFAQASEALEIEKVRALARRERGQDGQSGRLVDQSVETGELLKRRRHQHVPLRSSHPLRARAL